MNKSKKEEKVKTKCPHCLSEFDNFQDYARHLLAKHPEDKIRAKWARDVLEAPTSNVGDVLEEMALEVANRCREGASRVNSVTSGLLRERSVKLSKEDTTRVTAMATITIETRIAKSKVLLPFKDERMSKEEAAKILDEASKNLVLGDKLRDAIAVGYGILVEKPVRLSDLLATPQTSEFTAQMLSFEVGDVHKLMAYRERFGNDSYLNDLKVACAKALTTIKLLGEQFGYDPRELEELGLERFKKDAEAKRM